MRTDAHSTQQRPPPRAEESPTNLTMATLEPSGQVTSQSGRNSVPGALPGSVQATRIMDETQPCGGKPITKYSTYEQHAETAGRAQSHGGLPTTKNINSKEQHAQSQTHGGMHTTKNINSKEQHAQSQSQGGMPTTKNINSKEQHAGTKGGALSYEGKATKHVVKSMADAQTAGGAQPCGGNRSKRARDNPIPGGKGAATVHDNGEKRSRPTEEEIQPEVVTSSAQVESNDQQDDSFTTEDARRLARQLYNGVEAVLTTLKNRKGIILEQLRFGPNWSLEYVWARTVFKGLICRYEVKLVDGEYHLQFTDIETKESGDWSDNPGTAFESLYKKVKGELPEGSKNWSGREAVGIYTSRFERVVRSVGNKTSDQVQASAVAVNNNVTASSGAQIPDQAPPPPAVVNNNAAVPLGVSIFDDPVLQSDGVAQGLGNHLKAELAAIASDFELSDADVDQERLNPVEIFIGEYSRQRGQQSEESSANYHGLALQQTAPSSSSSLLNEAPLDNANDEEAIHYSREANRDYNGRRTPEAMTSFPNVRSLVSSNGDDQDPDRIFDEPPEDWRI